MTRALQQLGRFVLVLWTFAVFRPGETLAQNPAKIKRVLVLHLDENDRPVNTDFDRDLQMALDSAAPGAFERYSEDVEAERFPGERQSLNLRDYIRNKYAGRNIDVVVPNASVPLEFLFKYRSQLFTQSAVVFAATERPSAEKLAAGPGATGIVYVDSYRETLDLALSIQPRTRQVFVVSGDEGQDNPWEKLARDRLAGFDSRVAITYLTDLPLAALKAKLADLPDRSVVLYVYQRARDDSGRLLTSQEVLALVAPFSHAPIYGMSEANVGLGIVGGQVWTREGNAAKIAELVLKVTGGTRASAIPVESAPHVPMFDWRELKRWDIAESSLPPGSIVRFREYTMWEQYKWRIVGALAVFGLQAILIGMLLFERQRARRIRRELVLYKGDLEGLVRKRTGELEEARDQALAANRSKSTFLANMSHELRTPLNAILGFSNLLRDQGSSPEQRRDLETINRSGEHLLTLINDVLDVAKIEAGSIILQPGPCDLQRLVQDVVAMMQVRAAQKRLQLLTAMTDVPPFIRADAARLRQVLINLIGNAIAYTQHGSVTLRVTSSPGEDDKSVLLAFEIQDTGIGIAPEDQARICGAFVQAESTSRERHTGLGLTISKQLIELMGGTIVLKSAAGRGSLFRVEIPVLRENESAVHRETDSDQVIALEPRQQPFRILIVDDQQENRMVLERLLGRVGFAVRTAAGGAEAIQEFQSWHPQFIWMDLRMPGIDGFEATRRIRVLEGGAEVKIVAVTASGFDSHRDDVLAAGLDDYVRKPYRPHEIFECTARHLGVRYLFRESPAKNVASSTLSSEQVAELPEALRAGLRDAVLSLDGASIVTAIQRIAAENPALGAVLESYARRYAYTAMLNVIDAGNELRAGTSA